MIGNMNHTMQEAMRLMQTGDLAAATQAIQRGLNGHAMSTNDPHRNVLEGDYRVVSDEVSQVAVHDEAARVDDFSEPAIHEPEPQSEDHGQFTNHRFACDAGEIAYKLFVPAGLREGIAPPVLVMLHGCRQSPDDFARGTRMNSIAQEHGYVVVYPAQSQSKNPSKCWNWFRKGDQQRGRGEAALLAELTRHVVQAHGLDARRVFVAGLSAGGAMAAVLAGTYPDLFAAIGVHSGLPSGAAHDLPSALAAMKQGKRTRPMVATTQFTPVPAIVFHGDRDMIVNHSNGAQVVAQFGNTDARGGEGDFAPIIERGEIAGGRAYTKTTFRNAIGAVTAEHWTVHGGGHAWFGGDRAGSYTDPSGPDASKEMMRFFSACVRVTVN